MKKIIVDIDGTISKVGNRLKYLQQTPKDWDSFYESCFDDEPIMEIINLVNILADKYSIVLCTGRRESVREQTVEWIKKYFDYPKHYFQLLMRPDGDFRHDTEVKPELLSSSGYTPDNVEFILEDRNSMVSKWRELGFKCLQPADGDF